MTIMRSAYGPKTRKIQSSTLPSRAKQSFKKECDINQIMAKYQKTGLVQHLNKNQPKYGFASANSFHEAMTLVTNAETTFSELPSAIRRKFKESPAAFLAFCEDPANRSEMAVLGLLNPEATAEAAALAAATDSASAPVPPSPATTDAE